MDGTSLADTFQKYFSVDYATTPEQKKSVYGIRYRVYCDEFKYEPEDRFPDKAEFDEFDQNSRHCLITHKASGKAAGTVRLVPTHDSVKVDPLPFEKFCAESLDTAFIKGLHVERNSICEISRLAVDGTFRKRTGEAKTRCGEVNYMQHSPEEMRTFPLIAIAAFLASTALTDLTKRTNVFMMMEPFLPRLLERSGISVSRAGRDIEYHGIRAPYFITTDNAVDGMKPDLKGLYSAVYEQIERSYTVH